MRAVLHPWRFAVSYLLLFTLVGLYVGYRYWFAPRGAEFTPLYLVVLAGPWSFILLRFAHAALLAATLIGAGINAVLLYAIGRRTSR